MQYKCIDQLEKFYFRDARMLKFDYQDQLMSWELEGVVARYNNPVNETMADRYMDRTQVRLKGARITKFLLEGEKHYDANDVLLEEIPDREIPAEEYGQIFLLLQNSLVFWVKEKEASGAGLSCCEIGLDVRDEETEETDTYWLEVEYEKAVTEWDHFLNKAMLE